MIIRSISPRVSARLINNSVFLAACIFNNNKHDTLTRDGGASDVRGDFIVAIVDKVNNNKVRFKKMAWNARKWEAGKMEMAYSIFASRTVNEASITLLFLSVLFP